MDRASAVRARLDEVVTVARQAQDAGPPCSECRYRTLLGNCGNLAYAEPHFDAHSGHYEETFLTPVAKARSRDGLCGPEALLFEPQVIPAAVGLGVVRGAWWAARAATFGAAVLVFLSWLLR